MKSWAVLLVGIVFLLTACGADEGDKDKDTATPRPTATITVAATNPPSTPRPTPPDAGTTAPTLTPVLADDLPAIELLSAEPNGCAVTEAYAAVVGYEVRFYDLNTAHVVQMSLVDDAGQDLGQAEVGGENRDEEGNWGWYPPLVYEVPANTPLTMTVIVVADDVPTSSSSLTYNCTTGATITSSFERLNQ